RPGSPLITIDRSYQERTGPMRHGTVRVWLTVIILTGAVTGFPGAPRLRAADKEEVEGVFKAFQAALKARDAAKVYSLLDSTSRAAADRSASLIKSAYARATSDQKDKMAKALGLPGAELAKLTGEGFLKTKRFQAKYDEVPGSKIEKVTVQGNRATVFY